MPDQSHTPSTCSLNWPGCFWASDPGGIPWLHGKTVDKILRIRRHRGGLLANTSTQFQVYRFLWQLQGTTRDALSATVVAFAVAISLLFMPAGMFAITNATSCMQHICAIPRKQHWRCTRQGTMLKAKEQLKKCCGCLDKDMLALAYMVYLCGYTSTHATSGTGRTDDAQASSHHLP